LVRHHGFGVREAAAQMASRIWRLDVCFVAKEIFLDRRDTKRVLPTA